MRGPGDTALTAAEVHHLAGVLLHVDAGDAHMGHVSVLGARNVAVALAGRKGVQAIALGSPAAVTSRSRWPRMQKAMGPWVVWKFFAISGYM